MLLDVLNSTSYLLINKNAVKLFGLDTAVYLSEIVNIYYKATRKNKLVNNTYFKLDRKYVSDMTTIGLEDQLKMDINLHKINLITKSDEDPNIISIDINLYLSLIASEDVKIIGDIKKRINVKNPKGTKATQKQIIRNNLKNGIVCSNYELLTALRNWVDAICENPNNYLSKKSVELFQTTLNNYAKGDLDTALSIVNIAISQGYKCCDWAINVWEKDQRYKKQLESKQKLSTTRITEQKKATANDINKDISF